jgi:hypothetical protein
VEYPLNDLRDGISISTVSAGLDRLQSADFAIDVRRSAQDPSSAVACADVQEGPAPSASAAATPAGTAAPLVPTPAPRASATAGTAGAQVGPTVSEIAAGEQALVVGLGELNGSGMEGTAVLRATADGRTQVFAALAGNGAIIPGSGPYPAFIYRGDCTVPNPQPLYSLGELTHGLLVSTVDVDLNTLADGTYAIDVHDNGAQRRVDLACGVIAKS